MAMEKVIGNAGQVAHRPAKRVDARGTGELAGCGPSRGPGYLLKRRWRAAGRPMPLRAWARKEGLKKVNGAWTKV